MARGQYEQIWLSRFAIVMIKVPFAACWLIAFHQEPRSTAHVTIEMLHHKSLATRRPRAKLRLLTKKATIFE